jgi:hypothetical protein
MTCTSILNKLGQVGLAKVRLVMRKPRRIITFDSNSFCSVIYFQSSGDMDETRLKVTRSENVINILLRHSLNCKLRCTKFKSHVPFFRKAATLL